MKIETSTVLVMDIKSRYEDWNLLYFSSLSSSPSHRSRSLSSPVTGWEGRLVANTQCDYKLDRCSQRRCVLRSPHYPGLYPRNLTCTYHIFVLPGELPQGKQVWCIVRMLIDFLPSEIASGCKVDCKGKCFFAKLKGINNKRCLKIEVHREECDNLFQNFYS